MPSGKVFAFLVIGSLAFAPALLAAANDAGADHSRNLRLVGSSPHAQASNWNADIAFWGDLAFQGYYGGFRIVDISDPSDPQEVVDFACYGPQNDVAVWNGILVTSTDRPMVDPSCGSAATPGNGPGWEGVRVFDVSDPSAPQHVASVATDCGAHTITLVPDLDAGRALVYVSSYPSAPSTFGATAWGNDCQPTHHQISVVEVPLADPAAANLLAEPQLPLTPYFPRSAPAGSGCHDIGVHVELGLAAGACAGDALIMDVSDPANPVVLRQFSHPDVAFYHSGAFTWDGRIAIFGDEKGGGGSAECTPSNLGGRFHFHDAQTGEWLSSFMIPRPQSSVENCVAHNYNVIPVEGRYILVSSWYQGGTSVIDFTDPRNPVEIAYYDRPALDPSAFTIGGYWSSYWYNGFIYGSDLTRGLDVFQLADPAKAGAARLPFMNPQTQMGYTSG